MDLAVARVMQVAQEVCRLGDRLRLTASGGILDEVLLAGPFAEHHAEQLASHIELVVAWKDNRPDVLLVVPLRDQVSAKVVEPAVSLPNAFPQVGRFMPVGIRWVASGFIIAEIKG